MAGRTDSVCGGDMQHGSYYGSIDPNEIIQYISQNCTTVTLTQVGEHFSCHPNSISRILRKAYGLTFQEVLAKARAQMAKDMLARGATVEEAAAGCGYASLSHFTSMFERQCGTTPGEFRRQVLYDKGTGHLSYDK